MGCSSSQTAVRDDEEKRFHDLYRLGKKLGEGAFGQVRVAKPRQGSGGELAVKIVDCRVVAADGEPTDKVDRDMAAATKDEISIWQALGTSEHCVRLQASYYDKGLFYMVMEKCQCSLLDRLSTTSNLLEAELVRIFAEMLLGIQHVHSCDIVHRDIKPDNFLLGGQGGTTVKLADFGLATAMPAKGSLLKGVYGTAPYMSPELLQGTGYDQRTDVWSFGATAFLMVHGDFPYSPRQPTAMAMKKAILAGRPEIRFVRAPTEDEFFSRAFVDRATPFLQALLQRSPATRPTATDALRLPLLDSQTPNLAPIPICKTEKPLAPAVDRARKATMELRRPVNPIVQRNLDELLQRLQERHGASSPGRCFSECNEEDLERNASMRPEPSDSRIRARSKQRHQTHSGVVTSILQAFKSSRSDEGAGTPSTATPGSSPDSLRSAARARPSFTLSRGGRDRAATMPDAPQRQD